MLSPADLSNNQGSPERQVDCGVEKERRVRQGDNAVVSAKLIHVPDHRPHFYADLTSWAARAAAKHSRAKDWLTFGGRG